MALTDYKINGYEGKDVASAPDRLTGSTGQNKAVFDKLLKELFELRYNGLIDALGNKAAAQFIGADVLSVSEKTLSAVLMFLDEAVKDRYNKAQVDSLLGSNTSSLVHNVTLDTATGVLTVTKKDGTTLTTDTNLEKIPASLAVVQVGNDWYLRVTNDDGSYTETSVTNLWNSYLFNNTSQVVFSVVTNANNSKTVTATIGNSSVKLINLHPEVIADLEAYKAHAADSAALAASAADRAAASELVAIQKASAAAASELVATQKATDAAGSASAALADKNTAVNAAADATDKQNLSKSYAVGGTGVRVGEDTDNAKYYKEQAVLATGLENYLMKNGDGQDVFVSSFTDSLTRINITVGDSLKVAFGKIVKFFTDLKLVAFTGSYNDLDDKPTSLPANGGNADTLDGKDSTEFASNSHVMDGAIHVEKADKDRWNAPKNNLLYNSNFKNPVNHRTLSVYNVGDYLTYTIDRWQALGKLEIKPGYITHTVTDRFYRSQQYIEEYRELIGKTVTFSARVRGTIGKNVQFALFADDTSFVGGSKIVSLKSSDWEIVNATITIPSDSIINTKLASCFYPSFEVGGGSLDIEYIKLEEGSVATPFIPRLYGDELALCQKYYEYVDELHGYSYSGTFDLSAIYKTTKRTGGTVKVVSLNGTDEHISYWDNAWIDVPIDSATPYRSNARVVVTNSAIANKHIAFSIRCDDEIY